MKRGYIGIGGKARPFWTGGELAYWGSSDDGAVEFPNPSSTALVGYSKTYGYTFGLTGEPFSGQGVKTAITSYNQNFVKENPPLPDFLLGQCGVSKEAEHCIKMGGYYRRSGSNYWYSSDGTEAYTEDNTRMIIDGGYSAWRPSTATVDNVVFFAYGVRGEASNRTDIPTNANISYSEDLTRTPGTSLPTALMNTTGTRCGDKALFCYGEFSKSSYTNACNAITKEMTQIKAANLRYGLAYSSAATVNDIAIIAGGYQDNGNTTGGWYYGRHSGVYAYTPDLTKVTLKSLPYPDMQSQGLSFKDFALFNLTKKDDSVSPSLVVYDESLTQSLGPQPNGFGYDIEPFTVGDFAAFFTIDSSNVNLEVYTT